MPRTPSKKSKKNVQCQVCLKVYADATGLSRHSKTHLPDGESHKHQCPYCPVRMWQKPNLDSHIRAKHKCHKHRSLNTVMHTVFQPKQLLPAVDTGFQLEGFIPFAVSPQPALEAWFPKQLISLSDASQDPYSPDTHPTSPMFAENQSNPQSIVSSVESLDLDEMEQWLYSMSSDLGAINPFPFNSSFHAASPASSDDSVSSRLTSFVEEQQLSAFDFSHLLTSNLSLDDMSSTYPGQPALDTTDIALDPLFPTPIDYSLTGDFSLLSLSRTEPLPSPLLFDSGLSPCPLSSFDQSLLEFNFQQNIHATESFPLS
ncbi:hypothetical protein DFS33DRAFT_1484299 [Desarmillaria ectypa]|nr:hypothetical protein DFS33DRAFT_1484299 [Desarmillaria ectypa]